jgi:hypothetical protein
MVINSFILCGGAEHTDIDTMHLTHAGIMHLAVAGNADQPVPEGGPITFQVSAAIFAMHQDGDPESPKLEIQLRAQEPDAGSTIEALMPGWKDGPGGFKYCHLHFPLTFTVPRAGTYVVTVHPEGLDEGKVAAMYPLIVERAPQR